MPKRIEASNYQQLSQRLDDAMAQLQDPNVSIDEAVRLFEQALKLTHELEDHLKKAENRISELKAELGGEA